MARQGSGIRRVRVLGLESSCDDTAAAVVEGDITEVGARPPGRIRSMVAYGQEGLHAEYGGVVPEIAARAHAERADHAIEAALAEAGLALDHLDAVAVTCGPGLAPGLLAGAMMAQGVAVGAGLPLYSVNHLEAHAVSVRLAGEVSFPYLILLASGGHCLFAAVTGPTRYRVYGATMDDAPGEAYDKVARLLGLTFPGGPQIERLATTGDESRFNLPRPLTGRPGCDFSFSGLKTAVRLILEKFEAEGTEGAGQSRADLAASFQAAVRDVFIDRSVAAMRRFRAEHPDIERPVFAGAGGVLANRALRRALTLVADDAGFEAVYPEPTLCTDNGAMVAWAGIERIGSGIQAGARPIRARWSLAELSESVG